MNTEVESLGNLASYAELQAAAAPEHSAERATWNNAALRYRNAQEEEILKETFKAIPHPHAMIVLEPAKPSLALRITAYSLLTLAVFLAVYLVIR